MFFLWIVLSAFNVFEAIFTLAKTIRFRKLFDAAFAKPAPDLSKWPKVALLAPLKGLEEGIEDNIASWFQMDYPDYQVFFIIETAEDPAHKILKEFKQGQVFIAGSARDCGQKVHNLTYAIEHLASDVQVFAFVDSDTRLAPKSLSYLIAALNGNEVGAATGYRWFVAGSRSFFDILRAVWNSSILSLLSPAGASNFAWGGSMAIRRETFYQTKVLEFWQGSISDDYGVTNAMRRSSKKIVFVPQALAYTHDSVHPASFFSWVIRQLLITKVYNQPLWRIAFLTHAAWFIWVAIGLAHLQWFLPLFVFTFGCQSIKAELRLACVRQVPGGQKPGSRFYFWALSPLVALINFACLVITIFARKVTWRGVEYELLSPNRVRIRAHHKEPRTRKR